MSYISIFDVAGFNIYLKIKKGQMYVFMYVYSWDIYFVNMNFV